MIESYQSECGPALADFSPPAMEDESIGLYTFFPNVDTWASGHHTVTCIATSDTPRTDSLRG